MRFSALIVPFLASFVLAEHEAELSESATISIQPVGLDMPVTSLASISYDSVSLAAEITAYDALELPIESSLVRIGVYDARAKAWSSSTTVTAAESFSKGYSPVLTVSLDSRGEVLSVSCKSGKVDAGFTRDFGPKVQIVKALIGKQPVLNRPVALKDGKVEVVVPEKTFLQKYWMLGLGVLMLLIVSGGGDGK